MSLDSETQRISGLLTDCRQQCKMRRRLLNPILPRCHFPGSHRMFQPLHLAVGHSRRPNWATSVTGKTQRLLHSFLRLFSITSFTAKVLEQTVSDFHEESLPCSRRLIGMRRDLGRHYIAVGESYGNLWEPVARRRADQPHRHLQ